MMLVTHGIFTGQCGLMSGFGQRGRMEGRNLIFGDEQLARKSLLSARQSGAGFVQCVNQERNLGKAGSAG
jgi:hypothetical protein